MSSLLDICNRALSVIGTQTAIADLDEPSPEAVQCKLWYDNQRTSLLRAAPWAFARTQTTLTQVGELFPQDGSAPSSPYPYLFKYLYPPSCIKFRYVLPPMQPPANGAPATGFPMWTPRPSRQFRYMVHSEVDENGAMRKYLLSNVPAAIGVYTFDVTNTDLFDAMFDSALTSSLAYHLCIALTGNVGMANEKAQAADRSILNARTVDANEAIPTSDHVVDWMVGRSLYACGHGGQIDWGSWYCTWEDMTWGM